MSRTSKEIADLVQEVENGWDNLRNRAKEDQAQLYRHVDYEDRLISGIDPQITTRVPYSSERPDIATWQIEGIIRTSLSFHVEPKPGRGEKSPDTKRADKEELFYAHLWAEQLNKGNRVSSATHRMQAASPLCFWWLDWDGFALPKEEDKREDYRRSYSCPSFPITLSVLGVGTAAALFDDDLRPTVAVRHFDLPYVEIAKRYGKGKGDPLRILRDEFPYLRGGTGQSIESLSDAYTKKATVWVTDDNSTICTAIDIGGASTSADRFHAVEEREFPNPWGASSLTIITGRHNPDAELLEDQFRPLVSPVLGSQRKLDVLTTHVASISLTASKWGIEPATEEIARRVQEGQSVPVTFGDAGIASLFGKATEMRTPLDGGVMELLQQAISERDAALPPPYLTNPDQAMASAATAAVHLNAYETSNRSYDAARNSYISGISDVCAKVKHFITDGHLNKKGQPAEANESFYITIAGTEPTKKYSGSRKGEEITMGPDDFDDGDVLEITIVPSSQSQKQLNYELVRAQWADGVKTKEQLVETFTEDVSGQVEKLEEEARFQQWAPIIDKADLAAAVELIALEGGVDLSMLLMPAMMGPGSEQEQPPSSDGMSGSRTDAPATSVPDVGVMG